MKEFYALSDHKAIGQTDLLVQYVPLWRSAIERIDPNFATPDKINGARFVDTEGAEVGDAFLRLSDWSRNGDRNPSVTEEVGDLLFMLISTLIAAGGGIEMVGTSRAEQNPSTDELIGYGNNVFNAIVLAWWVPQPYPIQTAIRACLNWCNANDVDPVKLVEGRLSRILRNREERLRKRKV